jgi:hypothetical protein
MFRFISAVFIPYLALLTAFPVLGRWEMGGEEIGSEQNRLDASLPLLLSSGIINIKEMHAKPGGNNAEELFKAEWGGGVGVKGKKLPIRKHSPG